MSIHLGRILRRDEHIHHCNNNPTDNRLENFELWLTEFHGRYHGRITVLGRWRDNEGRFIVDGDEGEVPF